MKKTKRTYAERERKKLLAEIREAGPEAVEEWNRIIEFTQRFIKLKTTTGLNVDVRYGKGKAVIVVEGKKKPKTKG